MKQKKPNEYWTPLLNLHWIDTKLACREKYCTGKLEETKKIRHDFKGNITGEDKYYTCNKCGKTTQT